MSLCSRVLKGAALAAVVLAPTLAYADADGIIGVVASVVINESGADDYAVERGSIFVNEGSVNRKYQWGGTACSGRLVSEATVALLVEANLFLFQIGVFGHKLPLEQALVVSS